MEKKQKKNRQNKQKKYAALQGSETVRGYILYKRDFCGHVFANPDRYIYISIGLVAIKCTKQRKKKYLSCHGEEAQEKPPGL